MKIENFCDEKRTAGRMQRDARASTTLDPAHRDDLSGGGSWVGSQCWVVVVVVLFLLLFLCRCRQREWHAASREERVEREKNKRRKKEGLK